MAKYNVTFCCGHEGMVEMIGRNREFRLAREAEKLCPACYRVKAAADREAQDRKNAEWSLKAEAPAFTGGSEPQQRFAEAIRRKFTTWAKGKAQNHVLWVTGGWSGEGDQNESTYSVALLESGPFDLSPLAALCDKAEKLGPLRNPETFELYLRRARLFLDLVNEAFRNTSPKFWIEEGDHLPTQIDYKVKTLKKES